MSRLYPGAWRVLVITEGTWGMEGASKEREEWTPTEPAAYEVCERMLHAFAQGMPFDRKRVVRALIVPVAGLPDQDPAASFETPK